jgi:hypothetical protein
MRNDDIILRTKLCYSLLFIIRQFETYKIYLNFNRNSDAFDLRNAKLKCITLMDVLSRGIVTWNKGNAILEISINNGMD